MTVEVYALPPVIHNNTQIEPIGVYTWPTTVHSIILSQITGVRDQVSPIRSALRFGHYSNVSRESGSRSLLKSLAYGPNSLFYLQSQRRL